MSYDIFKFFFEFLSFELESSILGYVVFGGVVNNFFLSNVILT
jgi:hypothetical protein